MQKTSDERDVLVARTVATQLRECMAPWTTEYFDLRNAMESPSGLASGLEGEPMRFI